ncbi:MAG: restriction endonuclease [Bacteroidales bacterium]|nr:restriction endonuclease [Bacteroidales bacterium]
MNWKDYENEVYQECLRIYGDSVQRNIHIKGRYSGRERQIDVFVPGCIVDGVTTQIIIDAKHYSSKVDIKIVESFISMVNDIGGGKGIIISDKGFTKSAIRRAHNGPEGIEVDILSLSELGSFQASGAIPFSGSHGFVVNAPFGWIIDATRHEGYIASLYRRGCRNLIEAAQEKEFMYINIWDKNCEISSISDLLSWQEKYISAYYSDCSIVIQNTKDLTIRFLRCSKIPTVEITVYREFKNCILFGVLYCPDEMVQRDLRKVSYLMKTALYLCVEDSSKIKRCI